MLYHVIVTSYVEQVWYQWKDETLAYGTKQLWACQFQVHGGGNSPKDMLQKRLRKTRVKNIPCESIVIPLLTILSLIKAPGFVAFFPYVSTMVVKVLL